MIEILNKKISELEDFVDKIDKQQLEYPLDPVSKLNLHKTRINCDYSHGLEVIPSGLISYGNGLPVLINNKQYLILVSDIVL